MMTSACIAGKCLDVQAPTRACTLKLYRWAESDAEFLRLITNKEGCPSPGSPSLRQSHLCRQKFLRSYTFSKKETVAERTRRWLQEKEKKVKLSKDGLVAVVREAKDRSVRVSCLAHGVVIKCLFSCVVSVDVVEH
uniref:Sulfate transporter 1.2 n=1 Tax=Anthurium amnicola TaxID=1678845 RepID=A0A1D1YKN7_9ARAE